MIKNETHGWKRGKIIRGLLVVLVVFMVFFGFQCVALASDDSQDVGVNDVSAAPLSPPPGEATIVEHTEQNEGGNQLDSIDPDESDRTFENDIPSVTTTTIEILDEEAFLKFLENV